MQHLFCATHSIQLKSLLMSDETILYMIAVSHITCKINSTSFGFHLATLPYKPDLQSP